MPVYAIFAVIAIAATVFWSTPAHAWGPGMHLEIALTVLQKLALISPAIAAIISKHPRHFIYGAVAPDIQVGKKYVDYMHHCHTWRMGHLILAEAATQSEQAAAYGYLTHLAADTIAHSYFIPYKILESYDKRLPNAHIYWEMRFDLTVDDDVWQEINHVVEAHYDDFDRLLERVLKKTLFSFNTHKRIFRRILIMQKFRNLRRSLKTYGRASRLKLASDEVAPLRELTYGRVFDFLHRPETARCLKSDPTGLLRIHDALNLRRQLRHWSAHHRLNREKAGRLIADARQKLLKGLDEEFIWWPTIGELV